MRRDRAKRAKAANPGAPIKSPPQHPISALSAVAIALHAANKVYNLVEGIRDAPREIQTVSTDSKCICDTLDTLKRFLEDSKGDLPTEILQSLHIPLDHTRAVLEALLVKLKPFVTSKGELKTSKLGAMRWSFYQKDVQQLGEQLSNRKSTLNMALAVVSVGYGRSWPSYSTRKSHFLPAAVWILLVPLILLMPIIMTMSNNFNEFGARSILAILTTPTIPMNPIRLLTFSTPIVSIESRKLTICDEYRAVTDFHAQSYASGQQRELTPTRIKTADIKNDTSDIKIDTSEIIDYLRRLELDKRLGPEKPENYIGVDEAGNQRSDPRMQKINFALTRFLETASTTVDSLVQSPWASPTIAAQISAYEDDLEDEDDINLVHAPALGRENTEAEIHDILTKESAAFLNDDGQSALHLAATLDEYMTGDVLRHGVDIDIDIRNLDGETPLMCAVRTDKKDIVTLLLKNNANVNVRASESGHTCLHLAAEKDKTGIITRLLLKRGADLEATDEIGLTSLSAAAFHGNDVVARILLEQGADPQASEALHYATMRGNHAFMARLLNPGGPDFEAFYEASSYGFSTQPGRDTVAKRRVFLVRMLLDHGADVHARNSKGFTPLQIAAVAAQGPLVEILLEQGATAEGVTVICAYWGLSTSIVKLLIEKGANIHATDSRWNKPALTWEAEVGSPATMEVLLQHGADVHHHDKHCSALLYASGNARVEAVKLLVNAGADPNQLSHENKTSLLGLASGSDRYFLAGRWWEPSAADRRATAILLLDAENGCDPDAKDVYGRAAIHYAASNGWLGVVEVIVDRGRGDWEIPDDKGLTPLERAQQWGHLDVVRFLKRKKLMREEARDEQPGCVAGASVEVSET